MDVAVNNLNDYTPLVDFDLGEALVSTVLVDITIRYYYKITSRYWILCWFTRKRTILRIKYEIFVDESRWPSTRCSSVAAAAIARESDGLKVLLAFISFFSYFFSTPFCANVGEKTLWLVWAINDMT